MTPQEINEQIAKRLGYPLIKVTPIDSSGKDEESFHIQTPNFCGEIVAAWEIIDFIGDEYCSVSKCLEQFEGHRWQAQVGSLSLISSKLTAYADTPSMAIARAFLKMEEK